MSAQSRLASFIAAVGADIKSHGQRLATLEAPSFVVARTAADIPPGTPTGTVVFLTGITGTSTSLTGKNIIVIPTTGSYAGGAATGTPVLVTGVL